MTDDELLSDLRAVSAKLGGETLSRPQYDEHGTFNGRTVERRFGGWRVACAKAGLKTNTAGVKPDAPMIGEAAKAYPPRITASEPTPPPRDPVDVADERDKVSRLRSERNDLVDRLREERKRSEFIRSMHSAAKPPEIIRTEKTSGLREMTAIAMASDWHVEETVEPVKVNYRNEYNLDIADRRIARFFQGCVDLVEHHRADRRTVIRDMVCAFSGDLMTGHIHEELVESASLSPIETSLWLMPRLRNGIQTLLDKLQLRTLIVPWSYGNHGRDTKRTRIATGAEHSYEFLIGRMLEREFASEPRVKFDASPTFQQYAQVYDFTLGFTHGDSVNYWGGVGGLSIPLNKRIPAWDETRYAHYWYLGHFHQYLDLGRANVNGSLIGWAPFAQWIGARFEEPRQIFQLIDSKRGKCHCTPLWVGEQREAA